MATTRKNSKGCVKRFSKSKGSTPQNKPKTVFSGGVTLWELPQPFVVRLADAHEDKVEKGMVSREFSGPYLFANGANALWKFMKERAQTKEQIEFVNRFTVQKFWSPEEEYAILNTPYIGDSTEQ